MKKTNPPKNRLKFRLAAIAGGVAVALFTAVNCISCKAPEPPQAVADAGECVEPLADLGEDHELLMCQGNPYGKMCCGYQWENGCVGVMCRESCGTEWVPQQLLCPDQE